MKFQNFVDTVKMCLNIYYILKIQMNYKFIPNYK